MAECLNRLIPLITVQFKKAAFDINPVKDTTPVHLIYYTMGKKRVLISYGVDVDAVAGWLGSYGGEDSANGSQAH